ncbi:MAG: basic secretory family protein [Bacteroidales bacterium]|nr:basic secretory family protein [Bacteroidales bacterium]
MATAIWAQERPRPRGRSFNFARQFHDRDSLERDGFKLLFYSNAPAFDPDIKAAMFDTFFKVYPELVARFNPEAAKVVVFMVDTTYDGIAATFGGIVRYNPQWFVKNPKDIDVVTHEVMHIVQSYGRNQVPGWVTEGIADYVRHKYGLHNPEAGWSLTPLRPDHKYTNSYRITARFFVWLENTKDPEIVTKLNRAASEDRFTDSIWEDLTGKSIDDLWQEYVKSADTN